MRVCVIPAYNSESTIAFLIDDIIRNVGAAIVIDDGSIDNTAKIARKHGAIVYKLRNNHGKGFALRCGMQWALAKCFDVIATIDSDGENDPGDLVPLFDCMEATGAGAAFGCRTDTHSSLIYGFKITKSLINDAFSIVIEDGMSGIRAYTASALKQILPTIKSEEFGIDLEIALQLIRHNISIVEVPVSGSLLIGHEGLKRSHIIGYLQNLIRFNETFCKTLQFDPEAILNKVQSSQDFFFRIDNRSFHFKLDPKLGMYQ